MNHGVKQSLYRFLDEQPERVITAWELFGVMYSRTKRKTMPGTLLAYSREYADASGAEFTCIDPVESRYRYVPGFKIASALSGKE